MTYFTVQEVADFLEISPQRVRVLLAQRRLDGFKDSRNIWRIPGPFFDVRRSPAGRSTVVISCSCSTVPGGIMTASRVISDALLALHYGLPLGDVLDFYCEGRFAGAFYHRKDRCWYIPLPVRYHHAP